MATSHKSEVQAALGEVAKRLESDTPLTGLERVHIRALLEYASQQVDQIQELKRNRSKTPGPGPTS